MNITDPYIFSPVNFLHDIHRPFGEIDVTTFYVRFIKDSDRIFLYFVTVCIQFYSIFINICLEICPYFHLFISNCICYSVIWLYCKQKCDNSIVIFYQ